MNDLIAIFIFYGILQCIFDLCAHFFIIQMHSIFNQKTQTSPPPDINTSLLMHRHEDGQGCQIHGFPT